MDIKTQYATTSYIIVPVMPRESLVVNSDHSRKYGVVTLAYAFNLSGIYSNKTTECPLGSVQCVCVCG